MTLLYEINKILNTENDKMFILDAKTREKQLLSNTLTQELNNERNILAKYKKIFKNIFQIDDFFKEIIKKITNRLRTDANVYFYFKDNIYIIKYVKENPKNEFNLKMGKDGFLSYSRSHKDFTEKLKNFIEQISEELAAKIFLDCENNTYEKNPLQTEIILNFLNNYATERNYPIEIIKAIADFNEKGSSGYKSIDGYLGYYNDKIIEAIKDYNYLSMNTYFRNILGKLLDEESDDKFTKIPVFIDEYKEYFIKNKNRYYINKYDKNSSILRVLELPLSIDLENLDDKYSDLKLVIEYNKEKEEWNKENNKGENHGN